MCVGKQLSSATPQATLGAEASHIMVRTGPWRRHCFPSEDTTAGRSAGRVEPCVTVAQGFYHAYSVNVWCTISHGHAPTDTVLLSEYLSL